MRTVTLQQDIADQIEDLAQDTQTDATAIVDKALRAFLTQHRHEKIRAETQAFEQQRQELLSRYRGEYVAMYNGHVIDHDSDLRTLHLRVFSRLGHAVVLLKQVTEGSDRELIFRSPRFERGAP